MHPQGPKIAPSPTYHGFGRTSEPHSALSPSNEQKEQTAAQAAQDPPKGVRVHPLQPSVPGDPGTGPEQAARQARSRTSNRNHGRTQESLLLHDQNMSSQNSGDLTRGAEMQIWGDDGGMGLWAPSSGTNGKV